MVINALNNMWQAAADARRWMTISHALDILSEEFETRTAIYATAILTSEGVYLELSFKDGMVTELLEDSDIAEISPQAYAMLQRAGVILG
jgi:hypothetical protein